MSRIDSEQIRMVCEAYGAALALYARQWCIHPDDALQEALIELFRQDPAPIDPVAWLFKAVRFRAINLARSEARRAKHHQQIAEINESWFETNPVSNLDCVELQSMLTELPQLEREIVVARIWGEMSFEQIAELVESNSSSVHRRYKGALSMLQKKLNGTIKRLSE